MHSLYREGVAWFLVTSLSSNQSELWKIWEELIKEWKNERKSDKVLGFLSLHAWYLMHYVWSMMYDAWFIIIHGSYMIEMWFDLLLIGISNGPKVLWCRMHDTWCMMNDSHVQNLLEHSKTLHSRSVHRQTDRQILRFFNCSSAAALEWGLMSSFTIP